MTGPRSGRELVDFGMRAQELNEDGLRVALGYLIGAAATTAAVRKAMRGALDAAEDDQWSHPVPWPDDPVVMMIDGHPITESELDEGLRQSMRDRNTPPF